MLDDSLGWAWGYAGERPPRRLRPQRGARRLSEALTSAARSADRGCVSDQHGDQRDQDAQSRRGQRGRRAGNSSQPDERAQDQRPDRAVAKERRPPSCEHARCPPRPMSPCGLIINAVAQAITAANSSNAPTNIRAAANPAVPHICPRWRRSAYHLATLAFCCAERVGEHVPARAVGDEIERLGLRRIEHRLDARLARIGDRPVGQAGACDRCCSRCSALSSDLQDAPAERLALGDRVDDRRIGIELHADAAAGCNRRRRPSAARLALPVSFSTIEARMTACSGVDDRAVRRCASAHSCVERLASSPPASARRTAARLSPRSIAVAVGQHRSLRRSPASAPVRYGVRRQLLLRR